MALVFAIVLSVRFFILIQNQYKKQLRLKNEKLAKLNYEKNDLMSIIAHDLKTPLAQIKGVTEIQKSQITSFLDAKALDDKMASISFEKFDILVEIKSIIESMDSWIKAKNITVLQEYNSENINFYGSKDCINKIVSNLLSNAIKY